MKTFQESVEEFRVAVEDLKRTVVQEIRKTFPMKKFVIKGQDGSPYLTRRTLLVTRWGSLRLHKFHRSDEDSCLHDHPWPFISIILWRGYWELTPGSYGLTEAHGSVRLCRIRVRTLRWRWYGPGSVLRRPADWAHRVVLYRERPAVTLVWTGREERSWGFHTDHGWVEWDEYLSNGRQGCA